MKHLIVYRTCTEDQHLQGYESDLDTGWRNQPPTVGDVLSMGLEPRWEVIQTFEFKGSGSNDITVHLALINLQDKPIPEPESWICYKMQAEYPEQTLFVTMENATCLLTGFIYDPRYPKSHPNCYLGVELRNSHQIDQIEELTPQDSANKLPYKAVHLCHCSAKPSLVAA